MCPIVDPDTFLLSMDFLIEIGGNAIAIGDQAFEDRNFAPPACVVPNKSPWASAISPAVGRAPFGPWKLTRVVSAGSATSVVPTWCMIDWAIVKIYKLRVMNFVCVRVEVGRV